MNRDGNTRGTDTVVIDRLVLDGLDLHPGATDRLKAEVEAEASRILTSHAHVQAPELSNNALRDGGSLTAAVAQSIAAACSQKNGFDSET